MASDISTAETTASDTSAADTSAAHMVAALADITTFFNNSTRANNDATNKTREKVLSLLYNIPPEYLEDVTYGKQWQLLKQEWDKAIATLAQDANYTSIKINLKGGRTYNYDIDLDYYMNDTIISTIKLEFKYGNSRRINNLPQIISLQAKYELFPKTYDEFYYEQYIDSYINCDLSITEPKPLLHEYKKLVTSIKCPNPFFQQLKDRENYFKTEKVAIVNRSITDYLTQYGHTVNLEKIYEKIKSSQSDKTYLLWSNNTFHIDKLQYTDVMDFEYHGIKNGNVLQIKSNNIIYEMLLRWRNHKGILNPAWQISIKRL
uniref:Uncharacterized protein n=1 Tax=viral metagenome TaxID=1070528 RepID=A0A6C0JPG8_9ZZZZ